MSESRPSSYPNPALGNVLIDRATALEEQRKKALNQGLSVASLMRLNLFREVVNDWLEACGLDEPIKGSNSNEMQQALGRREIGLKIKKQLEEADLELYHLMVKEHRMKKNGGS
jgi:hypothetical protein